MIAVSMNSASSSSIRRYSSTAIALHWVLALALIGIFGFGLYMTGLPFSPARLKYFNWHKWAGMTILILSVLRLVWRITHRPPELPEAVTRTMPGWQRMAHHGVHHLMYALFFAIPVVGWMYSSAAGFPIVLFGQIPCQIWWARAPNWPKPSSPGMAIWPMRWPPWW